MSNFVFSRKVFKLKLMYASHALIRDMTQFESKPHKFVGA